MSRKLTKTKAIRLVKGCFGCTVPVESEGAYAPTISFCANTPMLEIRISQHTTAAFGDLIEVNVHTRFFVFGMSMLVDPETLERDEDAEMEHRDKMRREDFGVELFEKQEELIGITQDGLMALVQRYTRS